MPEENFFDQFDISEEASEAGLYDRFRLNQVHSRYRGTLQGAGDLENLAKINSVMESGVGQEEILQKLDPLIPAAVPNPTRPEAARMLRRSPTADGRMDWLKAEQGRYKSIVSDLQQYDVMKPWGDTAEAAVALGGLLTGGMTSAENLVGWPSKAATMFGRGAMFGLQQAGINIATDPIIQHSNIRSGVRREYDPFETAVAGAGGFVIGSGLSVGGELLGKAFLKSTVADMAKVDDGFRTVFAKPEPPAPIENEPFKEYAKRLGVELPEDRQLTKEDLTPELTAAWDRWNERRVETEVAAVEGKAAEPDVELPQTEVQALFERRGRGGLADEQIRAVDDPRARSSPAGTKILDKAFEIESLQKQATNLADALGFPLREGRVESKNALGTFNTVSGVVRVKEVPDFEVVAHEAGHHIEKMIGDDLTRLTHIRASELIPLDYDQGPNGRRPFEGFAEFVRRYIGNPANAQRVAPQFYQDFRRLLADKNPQTLEALDRAAEAYAKYINAPSIDAIASVVKSQANDPGWFSTVKQSIENNGFAGTVKNVFDQAWQGTYKKFLDKDNDVLRVVRELSKGIYEAGGRQNLVDLKAADDPGILIRANERSWQTAHHQTLNGVIPYRGHQPEGPSLAQGVSYMTGSPSFFGKWDPEKVLLAETYMIARRALYQWDRYTAGEIPNPPVSFSKADAEQAVMELERQFPGFRPGSDKVSEYARNLLRKAYESGAITKDTYDNALKEPFYVPWLRDLSDKPNIREAVADGSSFLKSLHGSSRDILSPIESLMIQTQLLERKILDNEIMRGLVNLSQKAKGFGGELVEVIPANQVRKYTFDMREAIERLAREKGMDPNDVKMWGEMITDGFGEDPVLGSFFRTERAAARGEPIKFYNNEDGTLGAARLISEKEGIGLYETLTTLPPVVNDMALNTLALSSNTLRAGVTTNPAYLLVNYIRDQIGTAFLRPGYIPFYHGAKGIVSEVSFDKYAQMRYHSGAMTGSRTFAPFEPAYRADINDLTSQGLGVKTFTTWRGFLEFLSLSEAGTRTAVYKKTYDSKVANGLTPYEAMIEAKHSADDIGDWGKRGSWMKWTTALTPFVMSNLTGLDTARRTFIAPFFKKMTGNIVTERDQAELSRAGYAAGLFAISGGLGAAWAALNNGKQSYDNARPSLLGRHFITQIGDTAVLIPKPFEMAAMFTAGEYAYKRLHREDPRAAGEFAEALWESMKPPIPFYDNPGVKTSIELYLGKSTFLGTDIVPKHLQGLSPEFQFNERTSEAAKKIGRQIGVSPMKVEHAIGGYFGTNGRDVIALSKAFEEDQPELELKDRVFLRRFLKDPGGVSNVTTKFWEFMGRDTGKYNQAHNDYMLMLRQGKNAEAQAILAKQPEGIKTFITMKAGSEEGGKPVFNPRERQMHPLIRATEAVTELNSMRRDLSQDSLTSYETNEQMKLGPTQRKILGDRVRELAQAEMFNALVTMKTPGYENQSKVDTNLIMERIRSGSPAGADEIARRYAFKRIPPAAAVAEVWPSVQSEVLTFGSKANIAKFRGDIEDFEFGAERFKRPLRRRATIPGKE